MEFLLEPLEMGSELDKLLDNSTAGVSCDTGYACAKGTIDPVNKVGQ